MKVGLAVFISSLLYASTASTQGITPNTAGAKPAAVFNTPGTFQQFPKPAAPSTLVVPVVPVTPVAPGTRATSDADTIRARETQRNSDTVNSEVKRAKKEYEQSKEQFKNAIRTITESEERKRSVIERSQ